MKKIFRQIELIFKKCFYEFFLLIFVLSAIVVEYKFKEELINFEFEKNDLLLIVLPLVLTIISIALSLPRGFIRGVDINDFRKFRTGVTIGFLRILLLSISVFTIFTIAVFTEKYTVVVALNIYIVLFSFSIVSQEIPLLMKIDKHIDRIIKKHLYAGGTSSKLDTVLLNMIFSKGLIFTFNVLKKNKHKESLELFEKLLSLQSEYLFGFVENYPIMIKSMDLKFKSLDVIDTIDVGLENIKQLLQFSDKFNIIEIDKDGNHIYHITRAIFSIQKILADLLDLKDKYYHKFTGIFRTMLMKIQFDKEDLASHKQIYRILNSIMISSISSENMWYVKLLNEYLYSDSLIFSGTDEYFSFVTVYIYYICEIEHETSKEFKKELKDYVINKDTFINHNNVYVVPWAQKLRSLVEERDINKTIMLFNQLVFIYDANEQQHFWYYGAFGKTYSKNITDEFRHETLIEWWFGSLIINDMNHILDKTEVEKSFAQINKDKEYIIARYLKENVLGDNDQIKKDIVFKIHQFYGLPARFSPNFIASDLVSTIGKFANEYYKNKLTKEYLASDGREEEFEEYLEILSTALNNAINDFDYLDTSLEFAEDSMRVLGFLCDTRWSEKIIKMQAEKISDILYSYVSSTFNKNVGNDENTILYDNFEQDALPKIAEMKPDFKSHSYFGYNEIIDAINREYINQIPAVQNIRLPYYTFIKEQAIKANFEYVPVPESIIRNLTNEEVNSIIDRDYKKIDGKYQYSEASNSKSRIWFTREEMISLISKKYFYVRVVFKAHVDFDWDKILFVKKNK